MSIEEGFVVSGEGLRNPETFRELQEALGKVVVAYPDLKVEYVGPEMITEDIIWEHHPDGLSESDFLRLQEAPSSMSEPRNITRALNAARAQARKTGRGHMIESDIYLIERGVIEEIIENYQQGIRPYNIGPAALKTMKSLLAHTRPAEPRT